MSNSRSISDIKSLINTKKVSSIINKNSPERITQEKLENLPKKFNLKTNKEFNLKKTEFLNVQRFQKLKINDERVHSLVQSCNNLGPFYSKCNVCNNKNIAFFDKMRLDEAQKITDYIKKSFKSPDN